MLFRPNVALVLKNALGEILICERSDWPGSWQFPQGGIKPGESAQEALAREVREEIGLGPGDYRVISRLGPYRYKFPGNFRKGCYEGQEQVYFLAELEPEAPPPDFGGGKGEFLRGRWVAPRDFDFSCVPPMKAGIYRDVLAGFFGGAAAVGAAAAGAPVEV